MDRIVSKKYICKKLEEMGQKRLGEPNGEYRSRAYFNAIFALEAYKGEITSGKDAQEKIRGIGKSIGDKIQQIIDNGDIQELHMADTTVPKAPNPRVLTEEDRVIKLFRGVHGVGPVKAKEWYNMGYRQLSDVQQLHCTEAIWVAVCYYHHYSQRVPRAEIEYTDKWVREWLGVKASGTKMMICGSYRRGQADSGEIDILVQERSDMDVISLMARCPVMSYIFSQGSKVMMGLANITGTARRIDVKAIPPCSWYYAILHYTGSAEHNVKLRQRAIAKGWKLSEYGLTARTGGIIPANSEKEIFDLLGMEYVPPEKRIK